MLMPGKNDRAEGVDRSSLLRRRLGEGLRDGAVDLLAKNAENFRDAQIGPERLRIGERSDLAAGIEMLRETGDVGIRVGSDAGVVLVVVFRRDGVLGALVPIEIGDGLIGDEDRRCRD